MSRLPRINSRSRISVALLVFASMSASCTSGSSSSGEVPKGAQKTQLTRKDLLQRITIAGTIAPEKKLVVTAPYSGYLLKLFVKTGDRVKKGDPLVSISPTLQNGGDVFPIRAPFAGVVSQVSKSEGEYLKEGDSREYVLRIDDLSKIYVEATAPEIDLPKVKVGQKTKVRATALPDRVYSGVVREVSLSARDRESWGRSQVEYPVKIELLDPDSEVRPGMSVVSDIITAQKDGALVLSHEFILLKQDKHYVKLANGSEREIKLGLQNEEYFEVVSGLNEGETVLQIEP